MSLIGNDRTDRVLRSAWALVAVFTLLTNAYFLRFLEPWVSRKMVAEGREYSVALRAKSRKPQQP